MITILISLKIKSSINFFCFSLSLLFYSDTGNESIRDKYLLGNVISDGIKSILQGSNLVFFQTLYDYFANKGSTFK